MELPDEDQIVNSLAYWARRHRTDWQQSDGGHQTLFFTELAIEHSPRWFLSALTQSHMSVCDVGCALGQGTVALAEALPGCPIKGVDFAETAIVHAQQMFPRHDFKTADMRDLGEDFDVLFLSNILEHFDDPWPVLNSCAEHARRYLWVLVPFYDDLETAEHRFRFTYDNIAAALKDDFALCFAKEIDVRNLETTRWLGEQILLIYARKAELEAIAPHGCEIRRTGDPASFVMPSPWLAMQRLAELSLSVAGGLRRIRALRRDVIGRSLVKAEIGEDTRRNPLVESPAAFAAETRVLVDDLERALAVIAEAELNRYAERLEQKEDRISTLQMETDEARSQCQKLIEVNALLKQKLDEASERLQSLAADHAEEAAGLRRDIDGWSQAYRADRTCLEAEIERAVQIVQQYQTSRSWRLTRPVREVARWLKKLLRREGAMFHDAQFLPVLPPGVLSSLDVDKPEASPAPAVHSSTARREFLDLLEERVASARLLYVQSCTIPWRVPLFQRPQHMTRALARNGAVALYFSSADGWADVYQEFEDNLFLVRDTDLLRDLRNAAVSFYSTSPAHSPELYRQVLEDGNILIYEYIDHINAEVSGEGNLLRLRNLFNTAVESAHLMAVSSRSLLNEVTELAGSDRVFYLPNAVDIEHYERARLDGRRTVPKPLKDIVAGGRPIIGYFGAIAPWLWYETLDEMAHLCSQYEFVLLGPDYFGGSKNLPNRSNVHWLGTVDYHDLPLWAQHFDVATILFSPGDIARTTSPLKLFEYFALGKPVVVTSDMDECTAFDEVFSGDGPEELAAALDSALEARDDPGYVERILHHAAQNSWVRRAATMIEEIERHLRVQDR